jgi:hypothetical protein
MFVYYRHNSVVSKLILFIPAIILTITHIHQQKHTVGLQTIHTILIYIQQDATLHSLFYLETALHVSGGTTASGMCDKYQIL